MKRRSFLLGLSATGLQAAWPQSRWGALKTYNREQNGVTLLILENGRRVCEDSTGAPQAAYELASGTKSFWGALAMKLKLDLDQPVGPVLKEWEGDARGQITLRQLLSLTSGIPGGAIGSPPSFADALQVKQSHPAGSRFQYGPAPFQCFGEYLRRKFQTDPLDLLNEQVLKPAGVVYQNWKRGSDEQVHLPSGARLTAQNWARFGLWVLQRQSELAPCFQGSTANPAYGLTWWLKKPIHPTIALGMGKAMGQIAQLGSVSSLPEDIWMAAGAGDQRLYLIPSRQLVIVRQADRILQRVLDVNAGYSDRDFLVTALQAL